MDRPNTAGFPPLDPATIAKAARDGRAYRRPHRLIGPQVHYRIEPRIPLWEVIGCAVVAALIGFGMAVL